MSDTGHDLLWFMCGVLVTLTVEYALLIARTWYLWARYKRELEEDDPL